MAYSIDSMHLNYDRMSPAQFVQILVVLLVFKQIYPLYCKTGNFRVRLIFANFATVIKTRKLIFVNIFALYYNIWVQ